MKYFVDIISKECRNKLTISKISHVEIMNSLTVSRTNLNLSKGKQWLRRGLSDKMYTHSIKPGDFMNGTHSSDV